MTTYPSNFAIGQRVLFRIDGGENDGVEIICYVRAVTFSSSKVRYALLVAGWSPSPDAAFPVPGVAEGMGTTIHNVDSCCVFEAEGEPQFIELGLDNYS